jgi:hypothetical protein
VERPPNLPVAGSSPAALAYSRFEPDSDMGARFRGGRGAFATAGLVNRVWLPARCAKLALMCATNRLHVVSLRRIASGATADREGEKRLTSKTERNHVRALNVLAFGGLLATTSVLVACVSSSSSFTQATSPAAASTPQSGTTPAAPARASTPPSLAASATATTPPSPTAAYAACKNLNSGVSAAARVITVPGPGVPPAIAAFSGAWEGDWIGGGIQPAPSALIVNSLTSTQVASTYVYKGTATQENFRVSGGTLTTNGAGISNVGASFTWSVSADGKTLNGVRTQDGITVTASMTRCAP